MIKSNTLLSTSNPRKHNWEPLILIYLTSTRQIRIYPKLQILADFHNCITNKIIAIISKIRLLTLLFLRLTRFKCLLSWFVFFWYWSFSLLMSFNHIYLMSLVFVPPCLDLFVLCQYFYQLICYKYMIVNIANDFIFTNHTTSKKSDELVWATVSTSLMPTEQVESSKYVLCL